MRNFDDYPPAIACSDPDTGEQLYNGRPIGDDEMNKVKVTERGWGGHFCGARFCLFRRNTLIEYGDNRIVVSTVGNYLSPHDANHEQIDLDRYYETRAFKAFYTGKHWDADVKQQISFSSPWAVDTPDGDDIANDQHDAVVKELSEFIRG